MKKVKNGKYYFIYQATAQNKLRNLKYLHLKNLILLCTTGLCFWLSLTSLLPVLPNYIQDIGATPKQVGLVMGCFAIGLLCFRTLMGNLADQRSRKLVISIGTFAVAAAPLGYLFTESIPLLAFLRAFHGISIAAFTTGYSTLVVALSPPKQRGELIGYMSLVIPIGLALGPALGGFLQEQIGYGPLFISSSIIGWLGFILSCQINEPAREKDLTQSNKRKNIQSSSFWQTVLSPRLRIPTAILLLIGLLFGTLVTFLPLFIRHIQLDFNSGLFYTAAAIASFAVRIYTGKASDRYGRGIFITGSLVCYGLSMIILASTHSSVTLIIAALLEGTGAGILLPMTIALMSDRSLDEERGRVYAICLGGFDLGMALGGPVLGSFANILGYRGIFSITAILAVLALVIFLTQSSKSFGHSLRFATGKERDIYALKQC